MYTYEVKIYRDGQHIDTQIVKAESEGQARSQAMIQTRVAFRGARASYEIRRLNTEVTK